MTVVTCYIHGLKKRNPLIQASAAYKAVKNVSLSEILFLKLHLKSHPHPLQLPGKNTEMHLVEFKLQSAT